MSLACFLAVPTILAAAAGFQFQDLNADSIQLLENGKPVFVYNHGMVLKEGAPERYRRSSYLHPVWAPDGTVLTDDFPADHLHHRGIFWSWPQVTIGGQRYDSWAVKDLKARFERWLERKAGPSSAVLAVGNGWYTGARKVVEEQIEITVRPERGGRRELEFKLTLAAVDSPVTLAGAPEQQKGYGGFSVRFAPRERTAIFTAAGKESGDTDMKPHAWANLQALFQGRQAGLRIDIDSGNPGYPNGWCLRHYGFLGVNFPGLEAYTLNPGKPLVLKYRVTVFAE